MYCEKGVVGSVIPTYKVGRMLYSFLLPGRYDSHLLHQQKKYVCGQYLFRIKLEKAVWEVYLQNKVYVRAWKCIIV
jgi:hypothetical protein